MIDSFLASWALFHNSYLAGWCISLVLSLIGVVVVARDQIFLGAAVSQASMLGISLGVWVGGSALLSSYAWFRSDVFLALMGGAFAVLGALATGSANTGMRRESHEAVTGWLFLAGASLSVLLLSHSPHGLEEVHRLLSSTIIGANEVDVVVLGVLAVAMGAVFARALPSILLLVMDHEMAGAVGVRVAAWNRALDIALGVTVGLSIRVSGVIFTFGCLVLPALVAKNVCREVRDMFIVAPTIAVAAAAMAFVWANHFDYPPGQATAALLCGLLVIAWIAGRVRPLRGDVSRQSNEA